MKVGLFGTGAYGLALASILSENNIDVTMWTKFEDERNKLITTRKNEDLLPGFTLDCKINITNSICTCCQNKDLLVIVIPAAFVDDLCQELSNFVDKNVHICIASKGIERKTGLFVHQIIEKYIPTKNISMLSGPSFAQDVIEKKAMGLTIASSSDQAINLVIRAFSNHYVKLRPTHDIIGTEICGAIKNVIALAAGILNGLGASNSTIAMLLTESIHDIEEIIDVFDGDRRTVLSFAGFGDLILTCTSTTSRNYTYGQKIGMKVDGQTLKQYRTTKTVEGYYTLESIYQLLKDKKAKIPIINLIYNIVTKDDDPEKLFSFLIEKT